MVTLKKCELRNQMLHERMQMPDKEEARMNEVLFQRLMGLEEFKNRTVSSVYTYVSCKREADTRRLISWLLEKQIPAAVPKVSKNHHMDFYYINHLSQLAPGFMDIPEPDGTCKIAGDKNALVILPGLAFDREGYRLGYGGGYYDRFLEKEPNHKTVGLAFGFQIVLQVPREGYDQKADLVVTSIEDGEGIFYPPVS